MKKSELRRIFLERRSNLDAGQSVTAAEKAAALFFAHCDLSRVRTLHVFLPIKKFDEIDTRPLIERLRNDFPQIAIVVPRVVPGSDQMESLMLGKFEELVENPWGILEPAVGDVVPASEIDIAIVPGVVFDLRMHRVGYGKGFYDRYLAKCRADCLKLGLGHFISDDLVDDAAPYDIALDMCITPAGIFRGSPA